MCELVPVRMDNLATALTDERVWRSDLDPCLVNGGRGIFAIGLGPVTLTTHPHMASPPRAHPATSLLSWMGSLECGSWYDNGQDDQVMLRIKVCK